ncbi:L-serine ammonia-lyase [Terracoccus luteus]|uniref:L-serine dehydratase n=1 Tax=Terracoccus luteus TaxID=53356 RepID=A0A495Y0C0_9MICO|nr:L-serine ammonia-lyase [Terracoccus luteus]RKT79632.1 L-serine ammonia-lyase [Terracoccus luteus]
MALSTLDMFTVGVGPSSSHTVGPMRAALRFVTTLQDTGEMARVDRVQAELYGSLGATGRGHGSDRAVVLGLQGNRPETVDTDRAQADADEALVGGKLRLAGGPTVVFEPKVDLVLHRRQSLPAHPNGMTLRAFDEAGGLLEQRTYFSVGGGFVVDEDAVGADRVVLDETPLPHPFTTGDQLLATCRETGMSISDVMLANELTWRTEEQVRAELLHIWAVMKQCVQAGCTRTELLLPGNLRVPRRAPRLLAALEATDDGTDPMRAMDWVGLYALAVNEENASGGRIVTAPTNGAAGIVPAVLHYYDTFVPGADDDGVVRFLLTAAAVGILFKINASISGAEVGCQGEVGSACAMAAAGLCEVMGGTPEQVENAAEIGIEHNLGLTCDPIGGLVQIPCIERNAVASNKAVNAARIAIRGDGSHKVSLDKAILTMRQTGADMKSKYKETSRGGLAVNVVEC